MKEQKMHNRPQKYSKISLKRRQELADLVVSQGMPISRASRRLGIKNSTAKLIVKKFKKGEPFFEPKQMRELRIKKEKQERERRGVLNGPENELNSPPNAAFQMQAIHYTFPFDYYALQCPWSYYLMTSSYAFLPLS